MKSSFANNMTSAEAAYADTGLGRMSVRNCLVLWVFLLSGCGTDAVTLPADYNEQRVKVITVDLTAVRGEVSALSGLQGGPTAIIAGDSSLDGPMRDVGTNLLRLPEGYLCEYSLAGTVPNPSAALDDPENYDFSGLEAVFGGASSLDGIAQNAGKVVYQSIFDIGLNTCSIESGVQRGERPADPARWAEATTNVMRYLNRDLLNPDDPADSPWLLVAQDYRVRWLEPHDDPLGRGGYDSVDDVLSDFLTMGTTLRQVFPAGDAQSTVQLAGPSMVFSDDADVDNHPLVQFIDGLVAQGQAELLGAVTFQLDVETANEAQRIAEALRQVLDGRGLVDTPLWLTRYELPERRYSSPVPGDNAALWSIFSGAWSNGVRIALQGLVDEAVYYRGDRERVPDGADPALPQSPLWTANGVPRPMWYAWYPWTLLSGVGPRVAATVVGDDAPDELRVMAIRQNGAVCPENNNNGFDGAGCLMVHVLVANTDESASVRDVQYQVRITGAETDAVSARVGHWRVDEGRSGPPKNPPAFSEEEIIPVSDGGLLYQVSGTIPGVSYVQAIFFNP